MAFERLRFVGRNTVKQEGDTAALSLLRKLHFWVIGWRMFMRGITSPQNLSFQGVIT